MTKEESRAEAWAAYEAARAPARAAYEEARAPVWADLEEARALAWAALEKVRAAPTRETSEADRDLWWATFESATAPAWAVYEEASAPASEAYREALVPIWEAYEEAIALIEATYDEKTKIEALRLPPESVRSRSAQGRGLRGKEENMDYRKLWERLRSELRYFTEQGVSSVNPLVVIAFMEALEELERRVPDETNGIRSSGVSKQGLE